MKKEICVIMGFGISYPSNNRIVTHSCVGAGGDVYRDISMLAGNQSVLSS